MECFNFGVNLAILLMVLSTLISVAYGAINWNKDAYKAPPKHVKRLG